MTNMNKKPILRMVCLSLLVILSILLAAQYKPGDPKKGAGEMCVCPTETAWFYPSSTSSSLLSRLSIYS